MNRQRTLDRDLEVFMEAGPEAIPLSALETALEEVEHTPQRPAAVASWIGNSMTMWQAVSGLAAAILVAVLLFSTLVSPRFGTPDGTADATPSPGSSPSPPSARSLEPEAVIPVSGAFLALADGDDRVWVSSDSALVAIDTVTGETRSFPVPVPAGAWSGLEMLDGSLWIGNFFEGMVYRVDRDTGEIQAQIDVGEDAVSITAAGGGIWVRTQGDVIWEAKRIDPASNTVVASVEGGNAIAAGHGSLWFSQRGAMRIIRADPVTGETLAVIDVPREHDCGVASSAAGVWASCLVPNRVVGSVVRIDPATNEAVTIHTGAGGGGAFDAEGRTWLATVGAEGGAFMAIDLEQNTVQEILRVGPGFDPDNPVISAGSVWVANDGRDEVYRFPLDAFR